MGRELAALLGSGVLLATSGAVMAHHSFAMFDQENPIELTGTVQEFKYTSPHSYILLAVKGQDGSTVILESLRARLRACWPGMDGRGRR